MAFDCTLGAFLVQVFKAEKEEKPSLNIVRKGF